MTDSAERAAYEKGVAEGRSRESRERTIDRNWIHQNHAAGWLYRGIPYAICPCGYCTPNKFR